ncbi:MAG: GNAT family N-acetyltransferase [Mariniblastus sp.]
MEDQSDFQIVSVDRHNDLAAIQAFLAPFMDDVQLLKRTSLDLELLLKHSFKALDSNGEIVGFCALEIYSKKLAELQCLAVAESFRRKGVGRELVRCCVARAKEEKVLEMMAVSSSDEMFKACGFDYSLPNQKRALFIQP